VNADQIKSRISELDAAIGPLSDERSRLNQELLEMGSPFGVGDKIQWKGKTGIVRKIIRWVDEPMWVVQAILKDGSLGSGVKVYPYYNPVLVEEGAK